jgi:hypothetical protein
MHFKFRSFALALVALLVLVTTLRAENVLFIGNSFTYGAEAPLVVLHGGVPKLFEEIARAKGRDVTAWSVTSGGKDWAWHLAQPATAKALAERPWNWVVLQDFSTRPTHVGDIPGFMRDGETFSDRIAAASPHAGIVLYETWARPAVFYTGGPGHDFTGAAQMMAELHDSYAKLDADLAKRDPSRQVLDAEVGTAFARTGDQFPAINLNAKDDHHSTAAGYYLAALVIYETIYHDSAKGAPATFFHGLLRIPPDEAADLQNVADEIAGATPSPAAIEK